MADAQCRGVAPALWTSRLRRAREPRARPGRLGLGCGDREPRGVADEEARQEGVGRRDRRDPRESELGDEPVLERPPRSLDPTAFLGLRALICAASSSSRAHPTWLNLRWPVSCSASVGGRFGSRRKIARQSERMALGRPGRLAVWVSIVQ